MDKTKFATYGMNSEEMTERQRVLSELYAAYEMIEARRDFLNTKINYYRGHDILDKFNFDKTNEELKVLNCLMHTIREASDVIERKVVR